MKHLYRSYTTQEILDIFIEQHRVSSPLDIEADSSMSIHGEMSIMEWRYANDLVKWNKLGAFLNQEFRTSISSDQWKNVLEPAKSKMLIGVCELIARFSKKDIILPIRLFGQDCMSAALFKSLKSKLAEKGVDVSELRPSSLFTPYVSKYFSPVMEELTLTGSNPILKLTIKRKYKKGLWNSINIFASDRYELVSADILTFRDLIEKMIDNQKR